MIKVIGIILLIYGFAGIIGTFIVYGALRGPLRKLRELLQLLSEKMNQGSDHAKTASDWIGKAGPILQKAADLLAKIVAFIREVAQRFGEAAGLFKSVEALLDAVKVPVLTFQTKTLDLSFGANVVTGVKLEDYNVVGVKVYGPPMKLETTHVGLNLGNVPVITGLNVNYLPPLQPVGDVFRAVGEKIDHVSQQIDQAGDRVDEAKDRALQAKENVENTAARLNDFADKLEEASRNVQEMSRNKLLALVPTLVLGYFGLIHFAFALTGLALLFIS